MSEPRAVASQLEEIASGLFHWRLTDERIGGATSASHAVRGQEGSVLVDPLPLVESELSRLEPVLAIVLTAATHQRAAWRYRRQFGAHVWLPRGSRATDEAADEHYDPGDALPGGLRAVHTPGPELPHFSLLLERDPRVLFSPDLVQRTSDGELVFVPAEFHDDPAETRRSVVRSLELDFAILCLSHGAPVIEDPHHALQALLDGTAGDRRISRKAR